MKITIKPMRALKFADQDNAPDRGVWDDVLAAFRRLRAGQAVVVPAIRGVAQESLVKRVHAAVWRVQVNRGRFVVRALADGGVAVMRKPSDF